MPAARTHWGPDDYDKITPRRLAIWPARAKRYAGEVLTLFVALRRELVEWSIANLVPRSADCADLEDVIQTALCRDKAAVLAELADAGASLEPPPDFAPDWAKNNHPRHLAVWPARGKSYGASNYRDDGYLMLKLRLDRDLVIWATHHLRPRWISAGCHDLEDVIQALLAQAKDDLLGIKVETEDDLMREFFANYREDN